MLFVGLGFAGLVIIVWGCWLRCFNSVGLVVCIVVVCIFIVKLRVLGLGFRCLFTGWLCLRLLGTLFLLVLLSVGLLCVGYSIYFDAVLGVYLCNFVCLLFILCSGCCCLLCCMLFSSFVCVLY